MKAEERKELETNVLGRWLAHMQGRLKGRLLYVIGGIVVLALATFLIVQYWVISKQSADSSRIMELISVDSEKKLDEIISSEKHKGKPTAKWAKLQKARLLLYRDGLEKLGTPDAEVRKAAFAKLEEGRKLYLEIVNDLKENPSLQQETWLSCAKAEEALLGAPKEEDAMQYRGSFDKMLEYYRKAAAINPDSEASKKYAADATAMQAKKPELEKFYQDIYRLGFTGKVDLK